MARYDTARFEEAATVYFATFGVVPSSADALEQVETTKANAATLAAELGEAHPAHAGLTSVATLRDSIAKRFIRMSVAPLAPAPTVASKAAAAREAKAAAKAAAPEPPKVVRTKPAKATSEAAAATA